MCTRMQKCYVRTLKIPESMSEFGGLWKHQNNPACTKSVKSLQNVEVGLYAKEEHGDTLVLHSSNIQRHVGVT